MTLVILLTLGCDEGQGEDPNDGGEAGGPISDAGGDGADAARPSGTCGNPGDCDLLGQDCGGGMACRFVVAADAEEPSGLCEVAGTKGEGEPCVRMAGAAPECAEGLICFEGVCREYCCAAGASDCSVLGHYCLNVGTDVGLCIPSDECDLLAQTGCDPEEACYPISRGTRRCSAPREGAGGPGETCEYLNDCVAGSACVGEPSTCRQLCDPSAAEGCPTDFVCAGLTGQEGIGVCVPAGG